MRASVLGMAEETKQGLAQRIVQCEGFRWMPGMLDTDGCRRIEEHGEVYFVDSGTLHAGDSISVGRVSPLQDLPDLDDPATAGCMLALILDAEDRQPHPNTLARVAELVSEIVPEADRGEFTKAFLAAANGWQDAPASPAQQLKSSAPR